MASISCIVSDELDVTTEYLKKLSDGIIPWEFYNIHQHKIKKIRKNVTKTKIFPIKEDILLGLNRIVNTFQSPPLEPRLGFYDIYQEYPTSPGKALSTEEEASIIARELFRYVSVLESLHFYIY